MELRQTNRMVWSCVAQPFCFSGKAGDFGAIHPQTISGGQGCRRKAPAFAESRKGWATSLVSSARAESQRLDYINNASNVFVPRAASARGVCCCFYLLPSRNPFPQRPWAAQQSASALQSDVSWVGR